MAHSSAPRTRALAALQDAGIPHRVHEYVHHEGTTAFGAEAAQELGGEAGAIFKTLMARLDGDEYVIAVVPVTHHLSLKALAKAAGAKRAAMADPRVAEQRTGYVVGGISPLGQTTRHRTFIDESALEHEAIIVSAGQRGLSARVDTLQLAELLESEWAQLCSQ